MKTDRERKDRNGKNVGGGTGWGREEQRKTGMPRSKGGGDRNQQTLRVCMRTDVNPLGAMGVSFWHRVCRTERGVTGVKASPLLTCR